MFNIDMIINVLFFKQKQVIRVLRDVIMKYILFFKNILIKFPQKSMLPIPVTDIKLLIFRKDVVENINIKEKRITIYNIAIIELAIT